VVKKIKEGDSFSAMKGDLLQTVIIERNDNKRLSYWIYDSATEKFVFHDIAKPSSLAKNHMSFILNLRRRGKGV
jgi:hypothetical protein